MMNIRRVALCVLIMLVGGSGAVHAQADSSMMKLQKMDAGPVELYGQILDMGDVYHPEGSYTWDQLKSQLSNVLPEATEKTMPANGLCDHLHMLNTLYARDNEIQINSLAQDLEALNSPLIEDAKKDDPMYPSYYAVSSRLFSPSNKGIQELFEVFPKKQRTQLLVMRSSVMSELLVSYVHDAALGNCQTHAQRKGYNRAWAPVDGLESP